jgi:uncharacterized membrane protein YkvA (DUF1232 family)
MARPRTGSRRRSRTGALLGRSLTLAAFLPVASRAPMYARLVWALVGDGRVSVRRKAVLAGAAGYMLIGRDLVPDSVPIIGGVDDLVVVVLAVELFLDGVPSELLHEKLDELGLDAAAFDRDVAQIRRLMPRPVRRLVRQLPRAVEAVVDLAGQAGVGPRLRSLIKEGSLA